MVEYTKINCKLANVQVNKLKKAVKSNEGASLRLGIKNFNKDELPHELLLTTRQNTKLRKAINNNLAIDIKLSKAQIKKLIQSGGLLGKLLSKLAGPLMKVAIPLKAYGSIMCGYYCIEFVNYMLKGKALLDYTNLFSPNDFKKNDQIVNRIFKK